MPLDYSSGNEKKADEFDIFIITRAMLNAASELSRAKKPIPAVIEILQKNFEEFVDIQFCEESINDYASKNYASFTPTSQTFLLQEAIFEAISATCNTSKSRQFKFHFETKKYF